MENTVTNEINETIIINNLLKKQAEDRPQSPAIQWENEQPINYSELYHKSCGFAHGLQKLNVQPDEKVLVMLPNSLDILFSWFSINLSGAIEVPINVHYKGSFLVHEVNDCEARLAIIHEQYLKRFHEVKDQLKYLEDVIIVGYENADLSQVSQWNAYDWNECYIEDSKEFQPVDRKVHDTQAILYTSGTTGPSKGVELPFGLGNIFARATARAAELNETDVSYVCHPLFHANAKYMQILPTLFAGGRCSIWPGFSASRWLSQIKECGATVTNTLGVMCEFIYRQPQTESDIDNPLRAMITLPAPKDIAEDFEKRFGLQMLEGFGMTEIGMVTFRKLNEPLKLGSAGKPLDDWFDVQIVDPHTDEKLGTDQTGEIVVRPLIPFTFMKGYHNVPHKTVEAWRNLWFHTGDLAKMDGEGYIYFVDRLKDSIRRRGENISSKSIEAVVDNHQKVKESAAVAVPAKLGEGSEDEIKLCVVLKETEHITEREIHQYCADNLPYFAVPRYIEILESIPKTANEKVRKVVLREKGVTDDTWDREAEGIKVEK
ncbi:AMP-binding protein [Alteribacillus sp. YIM 98480]|uniref:AMP-binding protein n=1 Tax=Alteribacillus sp. YIM 98480 TaxID=2606599 RepID=UPI00131B4B0A|nr:AMP-binding protein [Alteribacillus sp. YIM 98480]